MSTPQTPSESPIKPRSPGARPVAPPPPPPPPPSKKLVSQLEPQDLTGASSNATAPSPSSSIVIRKSPAPALPPSKSRPATPSTSDITPPPVAAPVVLNSVTTPRKSPPPALPPSKSRPTTPTASSHNLLAKSAMNTDANNNDNTINNNTSGSIKLEQSQSQSQTISGLQLSRSGVTTPRKKAPPTPPMSPRNNNTNSKSRPATPSASGKFVPPSPRTSTAAVRQMIAEKNRDLSRSQSQESSNIHGDTSSTAPGEEKMMRSDVQQKQQEPNETAPMVQEESTMNRTHETENRNEQDQQQQQPQESLIQQLPNEKNQEQDQKQFFSSVVNDDDSGRLPANMKMAGASVRTQAPTTTSDHEEDDDENENDKNNKSDSISTPILPTKPVEAQQQQAPPASSTSKPTSKAPSRSGSSTVQAVQQQQQQQQYQRSSSSSNNNSTSKLLIDPKMLPPAPSFQHERLALLRHLKETPKLVSHATSTEIENVNDEALNQFDEMHADNNMSSTLDEARVREAMKHDAITTNARSSSNHLHQHREQFHVSTPPPQKKTSSSASSSRDPYSSALSAALSTPHDQLVKKQQEEAILVQQRRIQQQQQKEQRTITSSSSVSNSKKSSPSPANPRTASSLEPTTTSTKLDLLQATNTQLQQYLFLRDLEVEELLFRSQISEHAIEFTDELRTDFWKSLFNVTQPLSKNRDLKVSDQSVQSLVLALEEAQTQSAHAADRLQETYDVLDRMSEELADSRSMTLQVQADLTHTREIHAATIEQMKLSHERERESWMDRAEEKFMKRVKKLASRVASQEQELMELRGAIASLRNLSSAMPGGSELALRIVEDALNVDSYEHQQQEQHQQHVPSSNRSSQQQQQRVMSMNANINQNISTSSRTGSQQQQQYYDASVDISNTNNNDDLHTGGTRRLFQSGVLDAQSATVRRLIEKGYLSPP